MTTLAEDLISKILPDELRAQTAVSLHHGARAGSLSQLRPTTVRIAVSVRERS